MEFKYRGLRARLEHVDVTDEEVTRQLVRLQQQSQRRTPVFDRPSQNGDELVLDYAGFADGQQFAGGTAEKQTLALGSGTFIPGFEEQLVGKNPGDDVTVHVTFPAQYHAPELAGKDAEFRCHIHEIRTVAPYALDDTFAKEVGECETMDEMRQKMRTSLEDYYAERAEMELRERLLHQAAASMDFTPDPAEISKAVEEQLDTMSAQLAQKNLTLEDYCKFTNSTLDQMREDARPGAEQAVRIKALVRKVAQLEDLHAAEEDVAQALSEICRANHMTMEELQPYYDDAFAAAVEYSPEAEEQLAQMAALGLEYAPVCIAKTQYSLSDNAKLLGRPQGHTLHIRGLTASCGAGFAVALAGSVLTMPGLPAHPAAMDISLTDDGRITGLF